MGTKKCVCVLNKAHFGWTFGLDLEPLIGYQGSLDHIQGVIHRVWKFHTTYVQTQCLWAESNFVVLRVFLKLYEELPKKTSFFRTWHSLIIFSSWLSCQKWSNYSVFLSMIWKAQIWDGVERWKILYQSKVTFWNFRSLEVLRTLDKWHLLTILTS